MFLDFRTKSQDLTPTPSLRRGSKTYSKVMIYGGKIRGFFWIFFPRWTQLVKVKVSG